MLLAIFKKLYIFITGAFVYCTIEILSRGFTHWSMAIAGGVCLMLLYEVFTRMSILPMWKKCLLGSLIITALEFIAGDIVNITLGMKVWDYSELPFNLFGQVCLPFTLVWFFLCIPAKMICDGLNKFAFNHSKHSRREHL